MARDDFIQIIERWFDWKHDMREFLEIVRDFPGVLELLPWPGDNGRAVDGVDYFDAAVWQTWYGQDQDSKKSKSWLPPQKEPLDNARQAIAALRAAELDPACTLYVAGHASTPIAVRIVDGQVEIGSIAEGDGRASLRAMAACPGKRASRRACQYGTPTPCMATWPTMRRHSRLTGS